jgi:alpha-tubulin suppressor-like RCC1 family protein
MLVRRPAGLELQRRPPRGRELQRGAAGRQLPVIRSATGLLGVALLLASCALGGPPPAAGGPRAAAAIAPRAVGAPRVVDLQYGGSFCALLDDGHVACWGDNMGDSLGDGTNEPRSLPRLVPGLDSVTRLRGLPSLGFCALREDASLWCWGFDVWGGPAAPVTARPFARDVVDFGFPSRWPGVCARHRDGQTTCTEVSWSASDHCELWADERHSSCLLQRRALREFPRSVDEAGPIDDAPDPKQFQEQVGCTLRAGQVSCEGHNDVGQLGDPSLPSTARASAPRPVPGLNDVVALSAGALNACAVRSNGVALCWGQNWQRQLVVPPEVQSGGGETCNRTPTPLPVANVAKVDHTSGRMYVVTRAGELYVSCRPDPEVGCVPGTLARVEGLPPLMKLVPGARAACAITTTREVYCYGVGQNVGDGTPYLSRAPVQVAGVSGAAEVDVDLDRVCARLENGGVTCWNHSYAPRGLTDVVGLGGPCALARDGRVWCWGNNGDGQMGLGFRGRPGYPGNPDVVHVPEPVPHLGGVKAIASDQGTTCALDGAGAVRCWGTWGPKFRSPAPQRIADLPPAREIWVGAARTCALAEDGAVWCWRFGEKPARRTALGPARHLPSHGPGPSRRFDGKEEMCVVGTSGAVACENTPAALEGLAPVKQLSLSPETVTGRATRGCAVLESGELRCWGPVHCAQGSPRSGAYVYGCEPGVWNQTLSVFGDVRQVSVGPSLSCAVRTDGSVWCWGNVDRDGIGQPERAPARLAKVAFDRLTRY